VIAHCGTAQKNREARSSNKKVDIGVDSDNQGSMQGNSQEKGVLLFVFRKTGPRIRTCQQDWNTKPSTNPSRRRSREMVKSRMVKRRAILGREKSSFNMKETKHTGRYQWSGLLKSGKLLTFSKQKTIEEEKKQSGHQKI